MKMLRPAFVATGVALTSCTPRPTTNPPHPAETTSTSTPSTSNAAPTPMPTDAAVAAPSKKLGVHPRDADNRLILKKAAGGCYVDGPKAGPPPKDLMSGETWTEHKDVPCPKEFNDPAFAAIGEGVYWRQDEATGECSQAKTFGNPPPPPVAVPCPPSLQKNAPKKK